jgi:hypothetical protein
METIYNLSIDIGCVVMQMKTWTSEAYEHFKSPTIERKGGEVRYVFVCKKYDIFARRLSVRSHLDYRNPSIVVTRVRHDESTSNLVRHADRCTPGATTPTTSISSFAHGSTYSYPKFRVKLALWVARRHRPFAIVEDDELIDIFMDLNNKVEVPSRITVSRDVREIFQISRVKVAGILQVSQPCNLFFIR